MSISSLEKEFDNPSNKYRGKPFWAWNSELEETELRRQIRIFRQMGLGGFFMHSRVGLKTDYLSSEWFDLIRACIDEAEKGDSEAWLYDEDRWPSGSAGGLVTKNPEFRLRQIVVSREQKPEEFSWPEVGEPAYVYGAIFEDEKISWYKKLDQPEDILILPRGAEIIQFEVRTQPTNSWYNGQTYLDTMNTDAVAKFIETTHEAYKKEVGKHFGTTVPGIFTDEPNHGAVLRELWEHDASLPWTSGFPRRFEELFGYDILQHLPELLFDLTDKQYSKARYHYHRCKTRMFVEAFAKQIGEWCGKNNLLFTGHVLEEQPISHEVSVVGSAMQFYPYMQAPGIDVLTQYKMEYITAKQCSSVARQSGRKWVLSELYGCTGWETTFEAYKHSGNWQAVLGITLRCPHLSFYSMAGQAKRDYPASIHFQSPWFRQYKYVEDYFSRLNVVLTEGEPICDLAVIHPLESYYPLFGADWATDKRIREMDDNSYEMVCGLLGEHIDFDFADEQLLTEFDAEVNQDSVGTFLAIGKMKYRAVLVPPMLTMRRTTLEILEQFAKAGGKVVFAGEPAGLIDAEPSDDVKSFASGKTVDSSIESIAQSLDQQARRVSIRTSDNSEAKDIFYQFRKLGDDWVIFMVNTNREDGYSQLSVKVDLELPKGGQIQLWDPTSGKKCKLTGDITYRTASFKVDIPASGSALVVIASQPEELPAIDNAANGKEIEINPTAWNFILDDHNVMVLDRADFQAEAEGKKAIKKSRVEILQLDRQLREYIGIQARGGMMVQPWVSKNDPVGPTAQVKLTYSFNVKSLPTKLLYFAMEQPERWKITLNGKTIDSDMASGWWVDPAIRTIPIEPLFLVKGKNILTIEGQFDRHANLEIIYFLGEFGAEARGKNAAITRMPSKLKLGSWIGQGLPFYSGNVIYRSSFTIEPEEGKKYFLKIPEFKATAVEVTVNNNEPVIIAWKEYQKDITKSIVSGINTIDIKVLGSRRNGFGPLHIAEDPWSIGPGSFTPEVKWQDEYRLVDYGLFAPPVVVQS